MIGSFYQPATNRSCAVGWINRSMNKGEDEWDNASKDNDGFGIVTSSNKFLREYHHIHADIMEVNDKNSVNGYIEPVVKDRVMHLLKDMVEAGY